MFWEFSRGDQFVEEAQAESHVLRGFVGELGAAPGPLVKSNPFLALRYRFFAALPINVIGSVRVSINHETDSEDTIFNITLIFVRNCSKVGFLPGVCLIQGK